MGLRRLFLIVLVGIAVALVARAKAAQPPGGEPSTSFARPAPSADR